MRKTVPKNSQHILTRNIITGKKVRGMMTELPNNLERDEMLVRPHTFFSGETPG